MLEVRTQTSCKDKGVVESTVLPGKTINPGSTGRCNTIFVIAGHQDGKGQLCVTKTSTSERCRRAVGAQSWARAFSLDFTLVAQLLILYLLVPPCEQMCW